MLLNTIVKAGKALKCLVLLANAFKEMCKSGQ